MVKVERSYPDPKSLAIEKSKVAGKYNCPDVIEQLGRDFNNKCYLCEIYPVQDPEVEHLLPHKNGRILERKFDWENLFWSCGHCNNVKNSTKYDDGILDCCKTDPEKVIFFRIEEDKVIIGAIGDTDPVVVRTVELLNEIYNKVNTRMRVIKCEVRVKELNKEMNAFYKTIEEYERKGHDSISCGALRSFLSRSSPFAAFKRCYIREHAGRYPELLEWVEV